MASEMEVEDVANVEEQPPVEPAKDPQVFSIEGMFKVLNY